MAERKKKASKSEDAVVDDTTQETVAEAEVPAEASTAEDAVVDEATNAEDAAVETTDETAAETEASEDAVAETPEEAEELAATAEEVVAEAEELAATTEEEATEEVAKADEASATTEEAPEAEAVPAAKAKTPKPKGRNPHIRTEVKDPPGKYAVIETGGKQYRVKVGDRLTVEKIAEDAGSDISFDRVLLLGGDGSTRIGTPVVEGAAVTATINDHGRGEKIVVFKYKAKKRYRRRTGHRQSQTYITITGITG